MPNVLPLPSLPRPLCAVQAGTALGNRLRGGISNSVNVIRSGPGRSGVAERWDLDDAAGAFGLLKSTVIGGKQP